MLIYLFIKNEKDLFGLSLVVNQNPDYLLEITISDQKLDPNSLSMFASSLKNNRYLLKLCLINCMIDDQGAIALGLCLNDNKNLKEFSVSGNKYSFLKPPYFLNMDFFFIRITNDGIETIANAINEHPCIEVLNVSNNLIDIDYFGDVLKQFVFCFF